MSHWSVPISSATWPFNIKCHIGGFQFPPLRVRFLKNEPIFIDTTYFGGDKGHNFLFFFGGGGGDGGVR